MAHGADHGPPYQVAQRLIATARDEWAIFDGWCASRGVSPLDLEVDRQLNLIYYWLVANATSEQRQEVDGLLGIGDTPERPTADPSDSVWSAESEMAAFTQAAEVTSAS